MKHIIKKQIIDLTLDKSVDAFSIQQKISDQYYTKIVPLLQQAFDAISSEDEVITIERLEVKIGAIDLKELGKEAWVEKVFTILAEQLIPVGLGLTSQIKTVTKARTLSHADQWMFYMRYGYLPWNALEINDDWYKNVLESFATDTNAINQLRKLINQYPKAVTRIVAQHSEDFFKALVETLTAENQDALLRLINELAQIKSGEGQARNQFPSMQFEKTKQKFAERVLNLAASPEHTKKIKEFLLRNDINGSALKQIKKEHEKKTASPDDIITSKDFQIEFSEEGIYVINSGIVILHPFLQRFFGNLELIKEGHFLEATTQQKALHLLHYLATGNVTPHEHELVMPKILCGFPLEDAVDNLINLTNEEIMEAKSLLESAIGQWTILKGTSPDGLREGFLQRKGKLFSNNGNMVLQVEQSAIDMLLDHLPWNLNIIKLPWMKDLLKVEWR